MTNESVKEMLTMLLTHTCTTCGWMQPNLKPPKKGQKFCRYEGAVDTYNNQCLQWKPEMNPLNRYAGSWVVTE